MDLIRFLIGQIDLIMAELRVYLCLRIILGQIKIFN